MNKFFAASLLAIAALFVLTFYVYPLLPQTVSMHWNLRGTANGFQDKPFIFFMPALSLILLFFLWYLPYVDPLRSNIEKFRVAYEQFICVFTLFFSYVGLLVLAVNLGWIYNIPAFLLPGLAVLFYFVGVLLSKAKQSWFIGIRTPWTLSSEYSWNKTHALGAKLFKAFAILFLLIPLLVPDQAFMVLIALVIAGTIALVVYSYLAWKKDKKKSAKPLFRRRKR